jgi:hypothetical protein
MKMPACLVLLFIGIVSLHAQQVSVHENAHAHNDYEHERPLFDALRYGFISAEADVHLVSDQLLVSHDRPGKYAKTLEALYLRPLDSLLDVNRGTVYPGYDGTFFLMIDFKTSAVASAEALIMLLKNYPALVCTARSCPVKIFVSGNRPVEYFLQQGTSGVALDGRPGNLGKGFTVYQMPVVSDRYSNWSSWNGKSTPGPGELDRIRALADRVHAEGKKLRLWAVPDHELAWEVLLDAGVDLLNTDRLEAMHQFLLQRGK